MKITNKENIDAFAKGRHNQLEYFCEEVRRVRYRKIEEADARLFAHYFLTNILGYSLSEVSQRYLDDDLYDFVIRSGRKNILVLEVKNFRVPITKEHIDQTRVFARKKNMLFFGLTNCIDWHFYARIKKDGKNVLGRIQFNVLKMNIGRETKRLYTFSRMAVLGDELEGMIAQRYPKKKVKRVSKEGLYQLLLSIPDVTRFLDLDPFDFERVCVFLLNRIGGFRLKGTPRSGDDGLDGIGIDHRGSEIGIQVKRYKPTNVVGLSAVKEFSASLNSNGLAGGYFITTSRFTSGALDYCRSNDIKPIDGEGLIKFLAKARDQGANQ